MKNKKLIMSVIVTITIIMLCTACGNNSTSSSKTKVISDSNSVGNMVGNIINDGIVTQQGNWIYYNNNKGLYKIKTDGTSRQEVCLDYAKDINVVGDWVYFYSTSDTGENKGLRKIKNDGSKQSIESEEIIESKSVDFMTVFGDLIYYSNLNGIYKIKTSGMDKQQLSTDNAKEINVVGDWIYYNSKGIYKVKTDGTGKTKILTDDYLSQYGAGNMIVLGDWIYYIRAGELDKVKIDGTSPQKLIENVKSMNVVGDWIYYSNNDTGLNKMKVDGTNNQKICSDKAENINIVENWIYYRNYDENNGLYRIKTDGSNKQPVE